MSLLAPGDPRASFLAARCITPISLEAFSVSVSSLLLMKTSDTGFRMQTLLRSLITSAKTLLSLFLTFVVYPLLDRRASAAAAGSSLQHARSFFVVCGLLPSCGLSSRAQSGSGTWAQLPAACGISSSPTRDRTSFSALEGGFLTNGPPGGVLGPDF